MNFVFISPNFPDGYKYFCDRLNRNNVRVLGIGDAPYDSLDDMLKSALTEYYKVDSLEDYDKVYRAVAFFAFKYGRIDWLESNNEYWLNQDARLRKDFHITTGVMPDELKLWQSKSAMKPVYKTAGIPAAREHMVTDIDAAYAFIKETGGYPVFAKPDTGVGASDTFKIESYKDLVRFFDEKPDVPYIMEEFIFGDIYSYDAVVDSNGDPLFESSFMCPNVAETVNEDQEMMYFVTPNIPNQLREYGRKAVKAFKVRSRFVHFEFFRLTTARKGLGAVGDFVGLEVNMRPAGGFTPDLINFAHETDVYQIWADMVTYDERRVPDNGRDHYCVFVGRKDSHYHTLTERDIIARYFDHIVMHGRMPDVLAGAMGNEMYTAIFDTYEEVYDFGSFILEGAVPGF